MRVQVLADESKSIADAMRHYGGAPAEYASASPSEIPPMQSAGVAGVETKQLEPVRTTEAIHQQLVETKPVQEVVQMPVTGANRIYVQAGAFTVLDNATRMQQTLSGLGKVTISDIKINGRLFHAYGADRHDWTIR